MKEKGKTIEGKRGVNTDFRFSFSDLNSNCDGWFQTFACLVDRLRLVFGTRCSKVVFV